MIDFDLIQQYSLGLDVEYEHKIAAIKNLRNCSQITLITPCFCFVLFCLSFLSFLFQFSGFSSRSARWLVLRLTDKLTVSIYLSAASLSSPIFVFHTPLPGFMSAGSYSVNVSFVLIQEAINLHVLRAHWLHATTNQHTDDSTARFWSWASEWASVNIARAYVPFEHVYTRVCLVVHRCCQFSYDGEQNILSLAWKPWNFDLIFFRGHTHEDCRFSS